MEGGLFLCMIHASMHEWMYISVYVCRCTCMYIHRYMCLRLANDFINVNTETK